MGSLIVGGIQNFELVGNRLIGEAFIMKSNDSTTSRGGELGGTISGHVQKTNTHNGHVLRDVSVYHQ